MTDPTTRREFVTTAPGGLDRDSLPLRLWEKAGDEAPFGLSREDFVDFALTQFQKRTALLESARGGSLEEAEGRSYGVET